MWLWFCVCVCVCVCVCSQTALWRSMLRETRCDLDAWWKMTSHCTTHTRTHTYTCFLSQWRVRVCVCITETSRYYWTLFTCARVHAGPDMSTPVHFSLLALSLSFDLYSPLVAFDHRLHLCLTFSSPVFQTWCSIWILFHPAPPPCCSPCLSQASAGVCKFKVDICSFQVYILSLRYD